MLRFLAAALALAPLPAAAAGSLTPLDWTSLLSGGHRAILVGEEHSNAAIKTELAAGLEAMRAGGITHVALEVPGAPGAKALAETAARLGLVLLSIAPTSRVIGGDGPMGGTIGEAYAARDAAMAARLARLLRDSPDARVLALVGHLHAGAASLPSRLRTSGHESLSLTFLTRSSAALGLARQPGVADSLETARSTGKTLKLELARETAGYDAALLSGGVFPR